MLDIADQAFAPLDCFGLSDLVGGHLLIAGQEIGN